MTRFALFAVGALFLTMPVQAQEPPPASEGPRSAPIHLISELAETLGRAHAVRTLCNGDRDGTWRDYMQTLMSHEGPSGPRRAALTAAFNRGFHSQNRETPSCTSSSPAVEARIASRGKELADTIARIYIE